MLKIKNYIPSNKTEILSFLQTGDNNLYGKENLIFGKGQSTFNYSGKLHLKYPNIFGEFCTFILNYLNQEYEFLDLWSNFYLKDSFVKPHMHYSENYPNSKSGVYYIQKPKDSGNIIINENLVQCDENDILIFNNTDLHWTQPNKSNLKRIVISFNLNIIGDGK